MDVEVALSTLALVLSLGIFIVASLLAASYSVMDSGRVRLLVERNVFGSPTLESLRALPMGPTGALSVLIFLGLTGGVISVVSLVILRGSVGWLFVSLISLAFMALIVLVRTYAGVFGPAYAEQATLRSAHMVRGLSWLLNPLLSAQQFIISSASEARAGQSGEPAGVNITELNMSVDNDGEPLDERERRMIKGVVELDRSLAREIMVPRVDIVAAESGTSMLVLAELMVESGHSRIPIYRESIDHVEGIAHARDVLRHLSREDGAPSVVEKSVVRPALFIPESKTLEELLKDFQERRVNVAIVVDEYGGISGLVTIEDLLEEIVGEIQDEFDYGEPEIQPVGDNEFIMDARVSLDELNDILAVNLEGEGFDSLGGFVYQRLGKIPSSGDTVEYDGLRIEVVSTVGRRLKRLRVTRSTVDTRPPEGE